MDKMKNEYENEITDYKNTHETQMKETADKHQKQQTQLTQEKDITLKEALQDLRNNLIANYQPEINRLQLEIEKMIQANEELLNT